MANRVLRDWTTSEVMNRLSSGAETFFTRLIMRADDYGSFYANPKLLKAGLFPLKDVSETTVSGWVDECHIVGLLLKYNVEGKDYIRIKNFGQRLRNMRNVFPPPPADNSQQVAANGSKSPPETKRNELETETEVETETNGVCDLVELDPELVRKSADLTEALCGYFSVKPLIRSKLYDSLLDYVSTVSHRNELDIASLALKNYVAYKNNSNQQRHGILKWIGTKDEFYQDGEWRMTDWESKNKNYNGKITGTSRTTSAEVTGTSYSGGLNGD